jgi:proline iminopeptidase
VGIPGRPHPPTRQLGHEQPDQSRTGDPLEDCLDELAAAVPAATVLIGGAGDPRPATALEQLGQRLNRPTVIIPKAGHEPWLEAPELFAREFRQAVLSASAD